MTYYVVKKFGPDIGLSTCFRQWKAESHCHFLHGYSLGFTFSFTCDVLDDNGWVIDFGGLKGLREEMVNTFDHHLCVASDDPELDYFMTLDRNDLVMVSMFFDGVGVEKFARYMYNRAEEFLNDHFKIDVENRGLRVISCECSEHGANSAIYKDG
jgi:6-pyruvoyltetrahydropterin/6-carboxytetrahydropterin synthase